MRKEANRPSLGLVILVRSCALSLLWRSLPPGFTLQSVLSRPERDLVLQWGGWGRKPKDWRSQEKVAYGRSCIQARGVHVKIAPSSLLLLAPSHITFAPSLSARFPLLARSFPPLICTFPPLHRFAVFFETMRWRWAVLGLGLASYSWL